MACTIRELAAACGVSIATVSKALHRSERISEATIRLVEAKAKELGYVGSGAARALAKGERKIAVLLPDSVLYGERYRDGIQRAERHLRAHGITVSRKAPEDTEGYDALLLHPILVPRLPEGEARPVATLGTRLLSYHSAVEVSPDYRVGGRLAAQFLAFSTGGAAVAVLVSRRGSYAEEESVRGFRELSTRLGVTVVAVSEVGDTARSVGLELRRLLIRHPRVKGLFVASPIVGTVTAALGEYRKRITVIGADFTKTAQEALRAGSASALLYPSPEKQAEEALYALCDRLNGQGGEGLITVRQELVLKSNLESYF